MKKKTKISLSIIFFTLASIFLFNHFFTEDKTQNIFDEIYNDELNAIKGRFNPPPYTLGLGRIEKIQDWNRSDDVRKDFPISEYYRDDALSSEMLNLSITFVYYEDAMSIGFGYHLSEDVSLHFSNLYEYERKVLTKSIYIKDKNNSDERFIKNSTKVASYLSQFEITSKKLNEYYENGMQDILLKDWLSVYNSKYSLDDLGNVKIVTEW